ADYADGRRWVRLRDEGVGSGGDRVIVVDCISTLAPRCIAGSGTALEEEVRRPSRWPHPLAPSPCYGEGGRPRSAVDPVLTSEAQHHGITEPTTTSPDLHPSRRTVAVHGAICVICV